MITRREFLAITGYAAVAVPLGGCRSRDLPLREARFATADADALPMLGLATSLTEEHDYEAAVEGTIPAGLRGTLFRNGPGLFERDGLRKRCLLDGDGMVRAFRFGEGSVRYQNRFVRTRKFREEAAAGKFLYPTWSTQAPGGIFANIGSGEYENQAGVTVVVRDGRLYAFDEFHPPYELDFESLESRGVSWLGLKEGSTVLSAHSRIDRKNGDWIFYGLKYGRKTRLYLTILDRDGRLKKQQSVPLPRTFYIHDFFATERHVIFNFHPVEIRPFPVLLGLKSMTGAMEWVPERGNLVMVLRRDGEGAPTWLETETAWMWHAVSAFEDKGEIVADFVGYRNPDHFLGSDPALFAIMEGRRGNFAFPGEIRRYRIDLPGRRIRQEILDAEHNQEFPFVNPLLACYRYRYGYFVRMAHGEPFYTAVARVDMATGRSDVYDFGPGRYCSEPVFAPKPGFDYSNAGTEEPGWLMTEVYDSKAHQSCLAIFRADALGDGPLAYVNLRHHVPLGFHGFWQAA